MNIKVQYQNEGWPTGLWDTFAETRFDIPSKMIGNYLLSIGIKRVRFIKTNNKEIIGKPISKPIKFKGAESP